MSTATLAAWAAESPRRHDDAVVAAAIAGLRDAIGCMLAGSREPEPRRVAAGIAGWGSGPCTIVGTGLRAPAPWAALVNGTAAHVLDYDDTFGPLSGHAAAVLVPTVLAAAEQEQADGAAVLDGFAVGLEVMARIGRVANPRHYALGWHATSTIGVIGAAAAAGRIMRLDARRMTAALSLAVSMAAGTRMQLGTPAKSFHAGLAAKGGILAAGLAAQGLEGNAEALGGTWRFASMYAGVQAGEDEFVPPAPGEPLALIDPGLNFKPYPTCAATHLTLDAVLALRAAHRLAAEDVDELETRVPAVNARNLTYDDPRTGMQARFSMTYTGAVALAQGRVGLRDFEGEAIFRPEIRALMPRVRMLELPGSGDGTERQPTEVTLRLRDGRVLRETRSIRRGSATLPMTEAEQSGKFADCAGVVLDEAGIGRALAAIAALPTLRSAGELTAALTS